jgi:glyoxylase-like metal-dependent hydrolase (beta-lactamase superfamily II)
MLLARSMHSGYLSNAYVIGDEPGGVAVFVDSGAPLEPLLELVERERLTPTHLLRTHAHGDHVQHEDELVERFGVEVVTGAPLETGALRVEAIPTPGHSDDGVSFLVDGTTCFSGDTLFRDAVGGGQADVVKHSVMERLMTLPPSVRVLPGHTEETTIGREWDENPFVRYWRGEAPSIGEQVRVAGEEAELVVWSPDYDGKGKALVRLGDGREAIVGGSRVERG